MKLLPVSVILYYKTKKSIKKPLIVIKIKFLIIFQMGTTTKRIVIQTIKEKDIWVQGVRNADFIGGGSLITA